MESTHNRCKSNGHSPSSSSDQLPHPLGRHHSSCSKKTKEGKKSRHRIDSRRQSHQLQRTSCLFLSQQTQKSASQYPTGNEWEESEHGAPWSITAPSPLTNLLSASSQINKLQITKKKNIKQESSLPNSPVLLEAIPAWWPAKKKQKKKTNW